MIEADKKRFNITILKKDFDKLERVAKSEGITKSILIQNLIKKHLKEKK